MTFTDASNPWNTCAIDWHSRIICHVTTDVTYKVSTCANMQIPSK